MSRFGINSNFLFTVFSLCLLITSNKLAKFQKNPTTRFYEECVWAFIPDLDLHMSHSQSKRNFLKFSPVSHLFTYSVLSSGKNSENILMQILRIKCASFWRQFSVKLPHVSLMNSFKKTINSVTFACWPN